MNDFPYEVPKLHNGRPALNDMPGRLRLLADHIEAGEYPKLESIVIVMNNGDDWPDVLQWGNVSGNNNPVLLLTMATSWLISKVTRRKA